MSNVLCGPCDILLKECQAFNNYSKTYIDGWEIELISASEDTKSSSSDSNDYDAQYQTDAENAYNILKLNNDNVNDLEKNSKSSSKLKVSNLSHEDNCFIAFENLQVKKKKFIEKQFEISLSKKIANSWPQKVDESIFDDNFETISSTKMINTHLCPFESDNVLKSWRSTEIVSTNAKMCKSVRSEKLMYQNQNFIGFNNKLLRAEAISEIDKKKSNKVNLKKMPDFVKVVKCFTIPNNDEIVIPNYLNL